MARTYAVHSHLSKDMFRRLLHGFIVDIDASKIAQVLGINRNTANRYFLLLRERIAEECAQEWGASGVRSDTPPAVADIVISNGKVSVQARGQAVRHSACVASIDLGRRALQVHGADVRTSDHILAEDFWWFAQERIRRFRGLHRDSLLLHLTECAWRFNHRGQDLYAFLHRSIAQSPLNTTTQMRQQHRP